MLTKKTTSKARTVKYAAVVLALVAVLVFCLASCGSATPTGVEYVTGSATKTVYNQGETFDCTGAQIKVTYDNGAVETKDVTKAMVGDAPLSLSTTAVTVTYSENGTTINISIPVTVNDPYEADKDEAIDKINENADVLGNVADKGVVALVQKYTVMINEAPGKAEIDQKVSEFETKLDEYLADKAGILAELDAVSLGALHNQYKLRAESSKKLAQAAIKAAATLEEARELRDAFKTTVDKLLDEQKVFEGDGLGKDEDGNATIGGLINDKIDILSEIKNYEELVAKYMAHLDANEAPKYNEVKAVYVAAQMNLEWWYEYVTLAESLDGVWAKIETEIIAKLRTPIDGIADELAKGITVLPVSYLKNEAGKNIDETGDLLAWMTEEINKATATYGKTMTQWLLTAYGRFEIDLSKEIGVTWDAQNVATITGGNIKAKYDELNAKRDAANATDGVNAKIDSALAATTDIEAALAAAWAALDAWADANGTMDVTDLTSPVNTMVFGKPNFVYPSIYSVELTDGKWTKDGKWDNDEFDKKYVTTYFIPKLDELVAAQKSYEISKITLAFEDIGKVLLSYTNADVDKGEEITNVEKLIKEFIKTYGKAEYDAQCAALNRDLSAEKDAAKAQYKALQDAALAANDAIKALQILKADARDIVISDYTNGEGLLKVAYTLYKAFATLNTDDAGTAYTDVIEYADATNVTGNETYLEAAMDVYVEKAYAEQKKVQTDLIINKAWTARLDSTNKTGYIPEDNTYFRTALRDYKDEQINKIITDHTYDESGKTMFNYDEVLAANVETLKTAANAIATKITGATYENGALVIPQ